MKITNESQLIDGQLYMRHSTNTRIECGEGCIMRWEDGIGFVLDRHNEHNKMCGINGVCDVFRENDLVWYETYPVVLECEITGHPMVIGEL